VRYDDINAGSSMVVVGWNPYRSAPLEPAAQRHVGRAADEHKRFVALGRLAVAASAPNRVSTFEEAGTTLERIITQDSGW